MQEHAQQINDHQLEVWFLAFRRGYRILNIAFTLIQQGGDCFVEATHNANFWPEYSLRDKSRSIG